MFYLKHDLFIFWFVFNANTFVTSAENVTGREEGATVDVSTPTSSTSSATKQPDMVTVSKLALEGGGIVVPVAKSDAASSRLMEGDRGVSSTLVGANFSSTDTPSDTVGKEHALTNESKHTDIDRLLETESEGSGQTKSSSVVARKGAPPEAPSIAEGGESVEVKSLFGDDTKSNVSAVNTPTNLTFQGNTSTLGNSRDEPVGKSSIVGGSATTLGVGTSNMNGSDAAVAKKTGNITISKPTVLHGHSESAAHKISVINSTSTQNVTVNSATKKKFKPATTSDEDELKEQLRTTDTPASKGDYIIPIIGIVLAVPMVIILFMFFYKRSAEFWERRHYKRMDFLIDGMYND